MQLIMQADIANILQDFEQSEFARLDLSFGSVSVAVSRVELAPVGEPIVDLADASVVRAPILGILQAGSEAAPLTAVGAVIESDTVVAVLRVLDKATEVKAGMRGTVIAIPVQNGDLVEFGQPVLYVREAAP